MGAPRRVLRASIKSAAETQKRENDSRRHFGASVSPGIFHFYFRRPIQAQTVCCKVAKVGVREISSFEVNRSNWRGCSPWNDVGSPSPVKPDGIELTLELEMCVDCRGGNVRRCSEISISRRVPHLWHGAYGVIRPIEAQAAPLE